MNHTTQEANAAHAASQAIVDAFLAAKKGNKIIRPAIQARPIEQTTINKKSRIRAQNDLILVGLNATEKVRAVLKKHKKLTRKSIGELTGLELRTVSKAARTLEDAEELTRSDSGAGMGKEVIFTFIGGK
jgi:hypothetical protein